MGSPRMHVPQLYKLEALWRSSKAYTSTPKRWFSVSLTSNSINLTKTATYKHSDKLKRRLIIRVAKKQLIMAQHKPKSSQTMIEHSQKLHHT
jgi:hypothetical protein